MINFRPTGEWYKQSPKTIGQTQSQSAKEREKEKNEIGYAK